MFSLKLFGGASLEGPDGIRGGRAAQRHRIALLALLSSAPTGGITRDKLIAFLWPDADPERGRHLLANSVYILRQALGKGVIVGGEDVLRLASDHLRVDVRDFEASLRLNELEQAVCTYRGPFLDGFFLADAPEFERWVERERERLAGLYAQALEKLAQSTEEKGDLRAAAMWWGRLAAHVPHSSRIALRLMRALESSGDPAAALQHARVHENILREELGIEPNAEVSALAERLQAEQTRERREQTRESKARTQQNPPHPDAVPDIPIGDGNESEPAVANVGVPGTARFRGARRVGWRRGTLAAALLVTLAAAGIWQWDRAGETSERHVAISARQVDPVAHGLYLRARNAWSKRNQEGLEQAVVYFRQAIERDPAYAEAYAGLADAYVILGNLGYLPGAAMFPKGKAAAMRAIELDSTLGNAYAPLGLALTWERRWTAADSAFRKAIEMNPDYATAHQWYALLLAALGRVEETRAHLGCASELDPLSLQINNHYATVLAQTGDSEGALRHFRKIIEVEPDSLWVQQNPWLLANASGVYAAHGMYDKALRALKMTLEINPTHPRPLFALASVYIRMEKPQEARNAFAPADRTNTQYPYWRGSLHAALGQPDSAFLWFGRVEDWSPAMLSAFRLGSGPSIRSDPRYPQLLYRLGLRQ